MVGQSSDFGRLDQGGVVPKIVDHDERRREIVEALWRVVSRDGAAGVSVRNVAAEAGMPKSSIGHYVGTMPQLLSLAIDELIEYVRTQAGPIDWTTIDLDDAVSAFTSLVPTNARRRQMSEVWLLLLSQRNAEPDLAPILNNLNNQVLEGIESALRGMRQQGLVHATRNLRHEARLLHALIDGLALQSLTDPEFMTQAEVQVITKAQLGAMRQPIMA